MMVSPTSTDEAFAEELNETEDNANPTRISAINYFPRLLKKYGRERKIETGISIPLPLRPLPTRNCT